MSVDYDAFARLRAGVAETGWAKERSAILIDPTTLEAIEDSSVTISIASDEKTISMRRITLTHESGTKFWEVTVFKLRGGTNGGETSSIGIRRWGGILDLASGGRTTIDYDSSLATVGFSPVVSEACSQIRNKSVRGYGNTFDALGDFQRSMTYLPYVQFLKQIRVYDDKTQAMLLKTFFADEAGDRVVIVEPEKEELYVSNNADWGSW